MLTPDRYSTRVASSRIGLALLWLLLAVSSIVQIQPAPYDGLIFLLCIGFLAMGMRVPANIVLPALLLGLFLLANVIAAFRIPDPRLDFQYPGLSILALPTRFHLALTWLFFVSVIYEDPVRIFNVIWKGFVVAAFVAVGFGMAVHYGVIDGGSWGKSVEYPDRIRGTFEDPNVYGPFVVVAAVYMVSTMETVSRTGFYVRAGLFVVLTCGVFLSFSRGAWGNLIASLSLFFLVRLLTVRTMSHQFKVMLIASGLMLGVGAGFAALLISGKIDPLFWERAQLFQSYDVEAGGRFDTQHKAIEYILHSPVGAGPGQARHSVGLEPHNLYLSVPLETGWLGAISLYSFILLTLCRGARFCFRPGPLQRTYAVVFACAVATALESAIIDTTHWRHLYLLWAMLWGPILACESARTQESLWGLSWLTRLTSDYPRRLHALRKKSPRPDPERRVEN